MFIFIVDLQRDAERFQYFAVLIHFRFQIQHYAAVGYLILLDKTNRLLRSRD